jgi:hypothetical protein
MPEYERGPLVIFEVTWTSGHVERLQAHQCTFPAGPSMMHDYLGIGTKQDEWVKFHGEIDGCWQLILSARVSDIRTVRNISRTELLDGGE